MRGPDLKKHKLCACVRACVCVCVHVCEKGKSEIRSSLSFGRRMDRDSSLSKPSSDRYSALKLNPEMRNAERKCVCVRVCVYMREASRSGRERQRAAAQRARVAAGASGSGRQQ